MSRAHPGPEGGWPGQEAPRAPEAFGFVLRRFQSPPTATGPPHSLIKQTEAKMSEGACSVYTPPRK